jgi:ATP sulfurylase
MDLQTLQTPPHTTRPLESLGARDGNGAVFVSCLHQMTRRQGYPDHAILEGYRMVDEPYGNGHVLSRLLLPVSDLSLDPE